MCWYHYKFKVNKCVKLGKYSEKQGNFFRPFWPHTESAGCEDFKSPLLFIADKIFKTKVLNDTGTDFLIWPKQLTKNTNYVNSGGISFKLYATNGSGIFIIG